MATTHKNWKNSPQRTRTAKVKAHPRERRCFAPQESNQYAFLSESLNAIPVVDLPESNAAFGQSTNGNQIIWHLPEDIEIDARRIYSICRKVFKNIAWCMSVHLPMSQVEIPNMICANSLSCCKIVNLTIAKYPLTMIITRIGSFS